MSKPRAARVPPWVIAATLAGLGIIGASAVFVLGSRGLDRDRADIETHGAAIIAQVEDIDAAIQGDVIDMRTFLRGRYAELPDCGGSPVPEVVEILKLRCEEVVRGLAAFIDEEPSASLPDVRDAVEAAREEHSELLCLARIRC